MVCAGEILGAVSDPTVKIVLKGLSQDPPTAWTFLRGDFAGGGKKNPLKAFSPGVRSPAFRNGV